MPFQGLAQRALVCWAIPGSSICEENSFDTLSSCRWLKILDGQNTCKVAYVVTSQLMYGEGEGCWEKVGGFEDLCWQRADYLKNSQRIEHCQVVMDNMDGPQLLREGNMNLNKYLLRGNLTSEAAVDA